VEHTRGERRAEQQKVVVGVSKKLQCVRIRGVLPQDRARLEHKLVCTEVSCLEEGELVLVR